MVTASFDVVHIVGAECIGASGEWLYACVRLLKEIVSSRYVAVAGIDGFVKWSAVGQCGFDVVEDLRDLTLRYTAVQVVVMRVGKGWHTCDGPVSGGPEMEAPFFGFGAM